MPWPMLWITATSRRARAAIACCALLTGGCELFETPFPQRLEGHYDAVWTRRFVTSTGAQIGPPDRCDGGLLIRQATDSIVRGSYIIEAGGDCLVGSGPLTGEVRRDGGVTLDAGKWTYYVGPCPAITFDLELSGYLEDDVLRVASVDGARCEEVDLATIQTEITATRR